MTFIVTRRSEAGEDRWNAASSSEIIDVVVRDLVETGSGFPTEDGSPLARQDREYAARAAAVLLRVDFPPFPKTKTIYGNSYTVEEIDSFTYPVELKRDDNGTILVTFPDVPGAITFGEDEKDALEHAVDALETMLLARMLDRKD